MSQRPTSDQDKTAGYPEETPDNKRDAQKPFPKPPRNPGEGGMERDPDAGDTAG